MCRANLSLSFDREGVSYFTVLSNDVNRHSNLNSKVRFNTGCFNIYSGKIQIGTLRHSNVKRQLLFKPKKKKEKMLSQSFLQIYRILLHFIGKEVSEIWNFVGCKLQMYLFSFSFLFFFFFFFKLAPLAMPWTLICLGLFNSWLIMIKWSFILIGRFYSCCNFTQCINLTQKR